ncbi:hypothetical protein NPX13_g6734 [Xylaria arbuscula]|uniref:Copper-fist domain-containing protein n=1 Tax=Xylaria arbuscula TaxID=114810 RepID=A0A9W8TLG3_9PEZI|nr:hypothetical protein NPX13_g6734 [Xylaria arbuscula]
MIPVRKPGRPLSSCPHQKGKPCNCNNITAAIPRNGKCGCGTAEPINIDTRAPVKTESSGSDATPMSPTKTTFRVQKHATPKSPSRKQSYDISLLGQMDPSSINVMPSHGLGLGTNGNPSHIGPISSQGFMPPNFQPTFGSEGSLNPSFEYARMLGRLEGAALNGAIFESPVSNASTAGVSSNGESGHSSIDTSGTPHYTPTSGSPSSSTYTNGISTGGGCCGKGSSATATAPANNQSEERKAQERLEEFMRYRDAISTHGPEISSLGFNGNIHHRPTMQHAQQNTVFPYPVAYGSSFYEPLQYSQWQEMMMSQSQAIPSQPQNAFMAPQSSMETTTPVLDSYTANQCGCGEGCQCLGCATHPFNSAMQEYVLSTLQNDHATPPSLSNGEINGVQNETNEPSPSVLASPIADSSPAAETGSTGMNDYLFVSYCPGSPQSCPCGDECACVGCMIHCQPVARSPPTPP